MTPDYCNSALGQQFIIAIPVKDEERRLPACLRALAAQENGFGQRLSPQSVRIVTFVNNSVDDSASIIRSLAQQFAVNARVIEATLPPGSAHAGNARGAAMDFAEAWLRESGAGDGVILTTDADSQVPKDWVARNLAAIDAGADAVLGCIALDKDGAGLPEALHRRGALENAYEGLLAELSALLDPLEHNPWPHHSTISGASLAVKVAAYRTIGGLPRVPLGEDKALVAALLRHDARLRFAPNIEVITSGRVAGRAPGGVADTLRLRSENPEAFCDEALQPFHVALRRALWRGRIRRLHLDSGLSETGKWRSILAIPEGCAQRIVRAKSFGEAWSLIEATSPALSRHLLAPADLPGQIDVARRTLDRIRKLLDSPRENVHAEPILSLAACDLRGRIDGFDKELSGLIPA